MRRIFPAENAEPIIAIHYEREIIIERPSADVYAYSSDVSTASEWMPWADETAVIDGPEPDGVADGQRRSIKQKQTDFGIQSETILEATEGDSGRSYTFESVERLVDFRSTYRFEPVEDGTRLTRTYHVELPGLARVVEPIVARRMKRRWQADLGRIKEILKRA